MSEYCFICDKEWDEEDIIRGKNVTRCVSCEKIYCHTYDCDNCYFEIKSDAYLLCENCIQEQTINHE